MMLDKDSVKAIDVQTASLQSYISSPEKQKSLYKRTLFVVSISQIFGGAGLAAGVTVGALIAQQMLGTDAFAGLPSALFTLGSAGSALIVGRLSTLYSSNRSFGWLYDWRTWSNRCYYGGNHK